MSARVAGAERTLAVRRPLVRPAGEAPRLLRVVRGWVVRRAFALGLGLVAVCIVWVWLRLQVTQVGYDLSVARQLQLRLEQERRQLEVELATLRDPGRLDDVARRRLGLTEPRKGQVVILR
jgi:cell division protein FtsL